MNKFIASMLLIGTSLLSWQTASAQDDTKEDRGVKTFTVITTIHAPIDQVWAAVGEDYGAIAKSHPKIIRSEYINGTLQAGVGAERICYFNEKGSQYLEERILAYDPVNHTFRNQVSQVGKFPLDPEQTVAVYRLEPVDATTTRFTIVMTYRTKPAFMGGMMKGSFRGIMEDYTVALDHHLQTGENVNKDNFKEISKAYAAK